MTCVPVSAYTVDKGGRSSRPPCNIFFRPVLYRRLDLTQNSGRYLKFTKRLLPANHRTPTLFETRLKQCGIEHKLIRPYTPRHNGKVERSHRQDNEYFYASHKFYSFDDFKKQLAVHSRKYNHFPTRPLGWKSPADYINAFVTNGEVF